MKRTLLELFAEALQSDRLVEMLFDKAANRLHCVSLRITADRLWTAAQASAISRLLSLLRPRKERNILPPWAPRRTRWPAIHARRRDRENELSVVRGRTRDDSIPALFVRLAERD